MRWSEVTVTESHLRALLGGDLGADERELALGGKMEGFAQDRVS